VKYDLAQGWAISGPLATCGPPQRFQWPAEAFGKIFKSEISPTYAVNVSVEADLNRELSH